MNKETLNIAKKIEKLKREFSMLPPLSERYSILEIEEYQHYLLELEELLIVFKYLTQQKPANPPIIEQNKIMEDSPLTKEEELTIEVEDAENDTIDFQNEVDEIEAEVNEILKEEENDISVSHEIDESKPLENSKAEFEEENENEITAENNQDIKGNETEEAASLDEEEEQKIETELEDETFVSDDEAPVTELVETGSSLNDQIKHEDNTVANKLAKQPIGDLRNAFGLNERFLFADELFGGDGQEFIRALNELNHLDSFEDAKRMIEARYENNFGWKKDNETVVAFIEVVERRYL